jgi:tetratricopeptide (TPR) repeat protein
MSKVGRNDPCPCGSGKKYKRCCRAKDEQQRLESRQASVASLRDAFRAMAEEAGSSLAEVDGLAERVLALIEAGQLDEAEACARKLEVDFPDETLGVERLAQVYEARGMTAEASQHYRRAVGMMDCWGEGQYCDCCRARMVKAIRRLDPDRPAPALLRDPQ